MSKITHIGTAADRKERGEELADITAFLNARWQFPDGTIKRCRDTTVGEVDMMFDGTAQCLDELPPLPASMKRAT